MIAKWLISLFVPPTCLVLLLPPSAQGGGCRTCVKKVVAVKRVIVRKKVFVPVVVPAYFVAYAPVAVAPAVIINPPAVNIAPPVVTYTPAAVLGYAAPKAMPRKTETCEERLGRVEAALAECLKKLDGKADNGVQPSNLKITALLTKKCASCHEGSVAEKKGKNFALFDGKELLPPAGKDVDLLLGKVIRGAMPPKDNPHGITPLTEDEIADVADWVEGLGKGPKKDKPKKEEPKEEEGHKPKKANRDRAYLTRRQK